MTAHVKVGGTWANVPEISAKVSGTWRNVPEGFTRVSGVWRQFFAGAGYYGAWLDSGGTGARDLAHDADGNLYLIAGADLVKVDATGTVVWNRETNLSGSRLAVKGTNVVFVTTTDEVVMYNTSGTFQWAKTLNHDTNDVDLDSSGNVYVVGKDTSNYSVLTKLDNTGAVVWTRRVRAESDTANRHSSVFVDDTNSVVYAAGQMAEAGSDHMFWDSYDLDGALQYRTKSGLVADAAHVVAGSHVVMASDLSTGEVVYTTLTGGWEDRIDNGGGGMNDPSAVTIDSSGYYYFVTYDSSTTSYFRVTKLDATNPLTTVWTRQIRFSGTVTIGQDMAITTDGINLWFAGRGDTSTDEVLFCIAADGSTTGAVTLNSKTYTIENGPSLSSANVAANADSYSTQTTAATATTATPTDAAGDYTLTTARF